MAVYKSNTSNNYYLQLTVNQASQSIPNNTSNISWELRLYSGNTSCNFNNQQVKAVINGTTVYSATRNITIGFNTSLVLGSGTLSNVAHNSDGTKSVACSFSWTKTNTSSYLPSATLSGSGTLALSTIARASTISSVTSSVNYGSNFTVNISAKSSSFSHYITISAPGRSHSYTLAAGSSSSTYTIPSEWMNGVPSATSGACTVRVQTRSGSTDIGSAVSASFTAHVPSNIVPSAKFDGPTYSNYPAGFEGTPIISHTTITCRGGGGGAYGSSITSVRWSTNGASGTSWDFSFVANTESHAITITTTDSRGRTASVSKTISCVTLGSLASSVSLSASSINYGGSLTATIGRRSTSFHHTVAFTTPGRSGSHSNQATSTGITIPLDWCGGVPSATSGAGRVTVTTHWGGTTVGSNFRDFTANVPSSVAPTISAISTSIASGLSGYSGSIIGVSTINASVTTGGTLYGASVSVSWSTNGASGSGNSFSFKPNTGTHTITATVRDSRGRSAPSTVDITSAAYSRPTLSMTAQRCDSNGGVTTDGEFLRVVPTFSYTKLGTSNEPTLTVGANTATAFSQNYTGMTSGSALAIIGNATTQKFHKDKSYTVTGTIRDNVGNQTSVNYPIAVSEVLLNFPATANALGIGMYSQGAGRLDIGWDVYLKGSQLLPFNGRQNNEVIFTVGGDANTYYPCLIDSGYIGFGENNINISRRFNWPAPDTWNTSTHRGGLTLSIKSVGASTWSGNSSDYYVSAFNETYTTMVAGLTQSTSGLIVWLRGGGAQYQIDTDYGKRASVSVNIGNFTEGSGTVHAPTTSNSGRSQVLARWLTRGNTLYDNNNRVYSADNKPSAADVGAVATSRVSQAASGTTVVERDSSADINARLFRSNFGNEARLTGAIAFRVNTSDNYIRFCSDAGQARSWLGAAASSHTHSFSQISAGTTTGRAVFGGGTGSDYHTGAIEIRERGQVSSAQSANEYAPTIGFHWGGRTAASLAMRSDGQFYLQAQGSLTAYRDLTLNTLRARDSVVCSSQVYALGGSNFISRQVANDSTAQVRFEKTDGTYNAAIYTPNNNYNFHVRANIGSWVLLRANSGMKMRNAADSAYTPCLASAFTVNSEKKWKTNIEEVKESALIKINNTSIFSYDKLEGDETKRHEIGLIIEDGIPEELMHEVERTDERTPEEKEEGVIFEPGVDKFVDLYSMTSLGWKATQELSDQDDAMEADITYQGMIMEHQEEVVLQQQADLDYQDMIIEAQELTITKQQADIDFMLMIMEG